ncbi:MAG TPA: hypothetical protein VJ302_25525 [Blastocatellia bacterium]|nr:hypothetical protein [Blastocatellia bacterium]
MGATMVAMMLAWGQLSVSLSLAVWEPDVCEMECCIAKGHCCCAARHAYVKGREPRPGEVTLNLETHVTTTCPAVCSNSTASAQHYLSRATPAPDPIVTVAAVRVPHCRDQIPPDYPFAARPSSPRAPPLLIDRLDA